MSSDASFDEKEIAKWTKDSIFYRPFLTTWIGSWLIFFGVTVLLIAELFLDYRPRRRDWTAFWGMVLVLIGGTMFSASTFVNQPILISLGGIFLTIGLGLYMSVLAWELRDAFAYSGHGNMAVQSGQHRAILGMISMITVSIGIYFFVKKAIQRFIRPIFGPNNFFLYGPLLFGAGSFSFFLLNIKNMADINAKEYKPLNSSARFGGYLFSMGAFVILLAVSRSYYSYDLLIIPSFPSLVDLDLSCLEALVLCVTTSIMSIGGFLIVVGEVLMFNYNQDRMITASSILLSIGYLSMFGILITKKKRHPATLTISRLFQGLALVIFSLGTALSFSANENYDTIRMSYGPDLRSAGPAIGLVASMLPFITTYKTASSQLLSAGNFSIVGDIFSFSAFLTYFLVGLATSTGKEDSCLVACNGSKDLASIFLSAAAMMYFFYSVLALDLATISDPFPATLAELLVRLNIPVYIITFLLGDAAASGAYGDLNPRIRKSLNELLFGQDYKESFGSQKVQEPPLSIPEGATVWETEVFIVGCGPTGLTLANEVGQRGINVIAIDTREHPLPDSRFFSILCTTVEGLKRLGVMEKIFARTIPQTFGHGSVSSIGFTHTDNKVIAEAHGPSRAIQRYLGKRLSSDAGSMALNSKWAEEPSHRVMQGTQELCLKERAEEFPNINIRYGWELISFHDYDKHTSKKSKSIIAMIRHVTTKEVVYVRADYLVGCDGPSSLVSKNLKVKFDGYANLGQTRNIHIRAKGLLEKVRPVLGEVLQYHISRPGYGIGIFVLNYMPLKEEEDERWTFFLIGLSDGRQPRQLSKEDMKVVVREFIGPDPNVSFEVVSDAPWFWNLFFARRIVYGHCILAGDSFHSWPPFGGVGGNTGYNDSTNLGWKLASLCKGWGQEGMLTSYDIERRQAGIKIIMVVLNFVPDLSQLLRLPTIAKYPWLWWTVRYRWMFGNRGAHAFNHFANDGLFLGQRYKSHIIYFNEKHQGIPSLECPPSKYTPNIAVGGRIPHIRFPDGSSLNDLIAFDGYTLLVIDPASIRVKDFIPTNKTNHDLESRPLLTDNDRSIDTNDNSDSSNSNDDFMSYSCINEISYYFKKRGIPIKIVDLRPLLAGVKDPVEMSVIKLYYQQLLVLVRPDMYITWHLTYHSAMAGVVTISTLELKKVAQTACAEVYNEEQGMIDKQHTAWLTRRFITNIQGYRHLHKTAIYFENQDKSAVIQSLIDKQRASNPEAHRASPAIGLVTKPTVWEGEGNTVDGRVEERVELNKGDGYGYSSINNLNNTLRYNTNTDDESIELGEIYSQPVSEGNGLSNNHKKNNNQDPVLMTSNPSSPSGKFGVSHHMTINE